MKAVIKLAARHTIEKNISEIVTNDELIEGLDKKTIRTLMYIATIERLKPDYSIVIQKLSNQVNEYILLGNLLLPGGIFVFVFTFSICDVVDGTIFKTCRKY